MAALIFINIRTIVYFLDVDVWEDFDSEDLELFDTDSLSSSAPSTPHSALVMWLVYLIAQIQQKFYVPNSAINLLLKLLSIVFFILSTIHPAAGLSDIPKLFPVRVIACTSFWILNI